jgi:hypothetical protein
MSAPDVQSVLCVGSFETSNNRDIGHNLSPSFSRKYTKYANYTPWPTPCEVAVEMQTMASCEHLAAATQGWAAFDWAEHCLKQERRIGEGDVCACRRSSTLRSESGKRTYSITAKRMISGLVLKYLNGECFVIRRSYETARSVSSSFCLTVPDKYYGHPTRILKSCFAVQRSVHLFC